MAKTATYKFSCGCKSHVVIKILLKKLVLTSLSILVVLISFNTHRKCLVRIWCMCVVRMY
jgi:hypothetical protein